MASSVFRSAHTFHIPVMGTGFTIDTALRVAKYGISAVISLVDDLLIEQMRKYHCEKAGEPYEEISSQQEDARALRITAFLDLLDRLIERQVRDLQAAPFSPGSDITRYYEMLPDDAPVKKDYLTMLATDDAEEKTRLQQVLREHAVPGTIDVNIMTKLDRVNYRHGKALGPEFFDAMAALRGYALSTVRSSIIFSAGINKRLYSYLASFDDFFPDSNGLSKKKIVLKVSDYRSAEIQGKFLAKQGMWVSEFRIESGLNCGGHAFASKGFLLGPILEEFKQKKKELVEKLHTVYVKSTAALGRPTGSNPQDVRITVQGGIGTAAEDQMLLNYYGVEGTGWGTPFLLVPEVVNIDDAHLQKLLKATSEDVYLSDSSPMGVPFWNLRTSASEEARRRRISEGKPGSSCPKAHISINTEFTERPICLASRLYQKKKLAALPEEGHPLPLLEKLREGVLVKSCICHDLAGCITLPTGIDPTATPAICCGPNIVNFGKVVTLEEMVGHIYGRISLLTRPERPHMFIREIGIFNDYIRGEMDKIASGLVSRAPAYLQELKENLLKGIEYYQGFPRQMIKEKSDQFFSDLLSMRETIEALPLGDAASADGQV
ncbi:MAG: hypothetical protein KKC76_17950 [Proteobacteria bacterium]|nr:hypothetical protein [Pseudomonadota bacterium]MBU4297325.1 hypothetical protein [Pseudomonadota bacterium]MCG2747759.1 hypothetical protein [Desulfobulbaceae bacterium]